MARWMLGARATQARERLPALLALGARNPRLPALSNERRPRLAAAPRIMEPRCGPRPRAPVWCVHPRLGRASASPVLASLAAVAVGAAAAAPIVLRRGAAGISARHSGRCTQQRARGVSLRAAAAVAEPAAAEVAEPGSGAIGASVAVEKAGFVEDSAAERVARSMELLGNYSEESHPGHQPGRFAGPGAEYDGMIHDPKSGVWRLAPSEDGNDPTTTALALMSETDRYLVTKFETSGGLALTLSNAFKMSDRLRSEARRVLKQFDGVGGNVAFEDADPPTAKEAAELDAAVMGVFKTAGLDAAAELLVEASAVERAVLMFQAADMAEERQAVMRNVWSDVEFDEGEESNAELVSQLEMQFARQLVTTTEARLSAQEESKRARAGSASAASPTRGGESVDGTLRPRDGDGTPATRSEAPAPAREQEDAIFDIALKDCSNVTDLAQKMPEKELTATLLEPRNLGVALDLVGVYLKNYEIDKADLVITRIVPLCRRRGGTWLVKGLDKLSAVRMKQFRAYDALVALKEIEKVVPFAPHEGWEFHDILYRNLAWCYSALDEPERCLQYTRKSVEVKQGCGIPATWFDIWDLGKAHARIGQKTGSRDEMQVAYDLCVKAGEIHRTAEASDQIMLAKILSNVGEVAMGIGDSYHLEDDDESARPWYEKAEPSLHESYQLHSDALGPMKPLSGWAAGTVAHCMVRLKRWEDARDYLAMAMKVECTKDSTTPGSVIELLDRVLGVQQQLGEPKGMTAYIDDLDGAIASLRERDWEQRERDVFALLLSKAATAVLFADDGTGAMIPRALRLLREAEQDLQIYIGAAGGQQANRCGECGKLYAEQADLDAHVQRRHSATQVAADGIDVAPKRFGPQADPLELLDQVRQNIRILELGEQAASGGEVGAVEGPRFEEFDVFAPSKVPGPGASFADMPAPAPVAVPATGGVAGAAQTGLGVFELRRMSPPFCTQLRYDPTDSREPEVFLPDILVSDGEKVNLLRVDPSGHFGYIGCRFGEGWVQLRYVRQSSSKL